MISSVLGIDLFIAGIAAFYPHQSQGSLFIEQITLLLILLYFLLEGKDTKIITWTIVLALSCWLLTAATHLKSKLFEVYKYTGILSKSNWIAAMNRKLFSFPSPYKYSLIIVVNSNIACWPSHLCSAPKSNYCDSALVEPLTIYLFCCLI